MQRRDFITMLGGSAMAWPLAADAQQPTGRVYRVGYLAFASREHQAHPSKALEEGLRIPAGTSPDLARTLATRSTASGLSCSRKLCRTSRVWAFFGIRTSRAIRAG